MSTDKEIMYWHSNPDWYTRDASKDFFAKGGIILKDTAPDRAKESFEKWKALNHIK